jgi:hypothetical protein
MGQVMFKGPEQLQALSSEVSKLKSEVAFYRRELNDLRNRSYGLEQMVGDSLAMQRLKQQIVKIAPLDVPVLLTGESGTGKELAAHAIHKLSPRRDATMVMVNAAALPATLVESELFGYEAGSFTGAERKGRKGQGRAGRRRHRCSSTRWATCRWKCRSSCCASCRTERSSGSAEPSCGAPTSADQRQQSQLRSDDRRGHFPAGPVLPDRRRHHPLPALRERLEDMLRNWPNWRCSSSPSGTGSGRRRCRPKRSRS